MPDRPDGVAQAYFRVRPRHVPARCSLAAEGYCRGYAGPGWDRRSEHERSCVALQVQAPRAFEPTRHREDRAEEPFAVLSQADTEDAVGPVGHRVRDAGGRAAVGLGRDARGLLHQTEGNTHGSRLTPDADHRPRLNAGESATAGVCDRVALRGDRDAASGFRVDGGREDLESGGSSVQQ